MREHIIRLTLWHASSGSESDRSLRLPGGTCSHVINPSLGLERIRLITITQTRGGKQPKTDEILETGFPNAPGGDFGSGRSSGALWDLRGYADHDGNIMACVALKNPAQKSSPADGSPGASLPGKRRAVHTAARLLQSWYCAMHNTTKRSVRPLGRWVRGCVA